MKVVQDLTEFYKLNDKDLTNILQKTFKNILKYHNVEDIKSEIYMRLHKKRYIQNYRPFEIYVDKKRGVWDIKPTYAKFSTYICKFVYNYIFAYYGKIKPDNLCLSLDDYNDAGFCEEDNTSLEMKPDDNNPTNDLNLKIEIDRALKILEHKTKHKGTLICSNPLHLAIARAIDKHGKKGCTELDILKAIFNDHITSKDDMTGLEKFLAEKGIKDAQDFGILKKTEKDLYILSEPERRSLYNLFKYYLKGYKDKEISEKFNMTVAGIGAMKRSLRKEIRKLETFVR